MRECAHKLVVGPTKNDWGPNKRTKNAQTGAKTPSVAAFLDVDLLGQHDVARSTQPHCNVNTILHVRTGHLLIMPVQPALFAT